MIARCIMYVGRARNVTEHEMRMCPKINATRRASTLGIIHNAVISRPDRIAVAFMYLGEAFLRLGLPLYPQLHLAPEPSKVLNLRMPSDELPMNWKDLYI